MKKYLLLVVLVLLTISCSSNNTNNAVTSTTKSRQELCKDYEKTTTTNKQTPPPTTIPGDDVTKAIHYNACYGICDYVIVTNSTNDFYKNNITTEIQPRSGCNNLNVTQISDFSILETEGCNQISKKRQFTLIINPKGCRNSTAIAPRTCSGNTCDPEPGLIDKPPPSTTTTS